MGKSNKRHRSRSRGTSKSDLRKRLRRLERLLEDKENVENVDGGHDRQSRPPFRAINRRSDSRSKRDCSDCSYSSVESLSIADVPSTSRHLRRRRSLSAEASLSLSPAPSLRAGDKSQTSLSLSPHCEAEDLHGADGRPKPRAPLNSTNGPETELEENVLIIDDGSLALDDFGDVLGNDCPSTPVKADCLHEALSSRWNYIVTNGLSQENLLSLTQRYAVPENCPTLNSPKLNPEVLAILANDRVARDNFNKSIQTKLATVLGAMGKSLTALLNDNPIPKKLRDEIVAPLGDASRLLAHTFHDISDSRRNLILPTLNKNIREVLGRTKPGDFLFGSDVSESVREAKSLQNAGKELKAATPLQFSASYRGGRNSGRIRLKPVFTSAKDQRSLNRYGPTRQKGQSRSFRGQQSHQKQGKYRR
ncbi:hypothetical protein PPYR_00474 [Photinus pyralis]|uniref:Uncharacterized protein n=1 Tax=Photinus pyralis TaxID=7054 RepID=A0A5N4B1Q3_PHOPY|nr:uncharacterized protein LOC116172218 [Photinus pyralis]XP_031345241.1 uncharacterized protein LOC116172218 [Photinus pyralis]XP_031345243.1 uncharacterized protein LOC116172218 [Photinus pyralis]XP_031346891.1 uncharacterized protein LOC116173523 [Photinus pyralis]XP_031346893.1 uncharacterized protein LOC116173523 [Photinus pyralis]XP_031346894.1 uncharacterized protein LOC116173523 [Photinus pyralis]XP_031351880.1 uncharacterized protein LOC116177136 [Photinus pyralis]XP_031351888.1 unc